MATKKLPLILRVPQELTDAYCLVVSRYGTNCSQALTIRKNNSDNSDFLAVADAFDRLKNAIGGKDCTGS